MKAQDRERIRKMYEFANDATFISSGITLERLTTDKAFQYSLLYPLGQIGELANNIGKNVPLTYPNIEWSDWRGFRNRVFHDYGMIDFEIVLEMITEALPLLLSDLREVLAALGNE